MLQWMGGSRRKVTTSRKSIQKRQKQYFEQRRRQQHQQTAGLESSEGGGNKWEQNHKEHQSLDILNLLNFSTSSQQCRPNCPSEREDPKVTSTVKYCITADPPIFQANTVTPADSLEIKKASFLSGCQVETLSPKKVQFVSQDNQSNTFNGNDNKPDIWKTATQQQLSFFDLLGDDESNGNLLRSPTHEAHVAFSVDGLGKVGTKTPLHSPLQPDRYASYGCSSPSKAARKLNSSRNLYCVLNDLELQVDAIMQDIEMPESGSSSEFSTGIKDSYSNLKKNLHTVRDHMQLDGQGSKIRSSYCDGKLFCSTGNDTEGLWDARSSLLDTHFPDEKQRDIWPCHPDDGSADFLNYGGNEMPNYAFGGPHLVKKRGAARATERFSFLESDLPAPKHRTLENDYDFAISKGASDRHHLVGTNFDFGDVTGHLDWSCFTKEDARENTSLLSEESCSSTAVRGEVSNISVANSRARDGRRHQSDFGCPEIKHGAKNILAKEKHFKNKDDLQKRNSVCQPGKSTQIPTLSESKSIHNLNYLSQEKIGSQGSWLFEDGYRSADMNLGFSSLCGTSEIKHPSSGSMPFVEDIFDIFPVPEPHTDAKFSCSRSKHSSAFKSSPSGSCISKKFFTQPSSDKHSHDSPSPKVEFWATKPDFSPDSPDFELESRPLHSSQDDVSHGEKLISNLSGQESVSKDEETKSESEHATCDNIKPQKEILVGKNLKLVEDLDSAEYSPEWKELKDRTLETSSYVKMSDKSESSVDGKSNHHGDEFPLLCQNRKKEIATERPGERKNGGKRLCNCLNSSPQLMMLESFVLQLLCVQKVPNEASGQFP